jgi:tetratricopeptide (TPR) repeat protein
MKKLLPYILVFCFAIVAMQISYAQQNNPTQWKQALAEAEKQGNNSQTADIAYQLAVFYVQQNDQTTALTYTLTALKSAESLNKTPENDKKVADLHFLLAKIYRNQKAYNKSVEYLQKAQSFYQISKPTEWTKEIAECYTLQKDYANAEKNYADLLQIALQNKDLATETLALSNLLSLCSAQKKYVAALDYAQKLSANYEKIKASNPNSKDAKNTENLALAYQNTGYLFRQQGDLRNSALYLNKAIEEFSKLNQENLAVANNMAVTYSMLGNFLAAETYYNKAIDLSSKSKNPEDLATAYNLLAGNELLRKHSFNAMLLAEKAIEVATPINAYKALADAYLVLNNAYTQQSDFKQAQENFKKSEEYRQLLAQQIAKQKEETQKTQANIQQTENDLLLGLAEKEKQNLTLKQMALEAQKQEQALQILQQEKNLQAVRLKNEELAKAAAEQQLKITQQRLETERKNKEIALLEQQKQLQSLEIEKKQAQQEEQKKALELEKNRNQLLETNKKVQDLELKEGKNREQLAYWIIIAAFLIVLIVAVAAWRNHQQNKLLKIQQMEIAEKNAELQASEEELRQNSDMLVMMNDNILETLEQVQEQKLIIEKKNGDIVASINYALRIQKAILPPISQIRAIFPESFVFYKPRDIVSGDFYWFTELLNHTILVAADCTGHGVAGAFMTMIGNNILSQIIDEQGITSPNAIIKQVPILLNKILTSDGKVRDSMDLAVLTIEKTPKTALNLKKLGKVKIDYAGAMFPLYYIQNQEFIEIKADKMPIGLSIEKDFTYTNHELIIDKPTMIYLASDGYQDQFGGVNNRRFMKKQLRELLLSIANQDIVTQEKVIINTITDWQAQTTEPQTDDMTLIGIRIA